MFGFESFGNPLLTRIILAELSMRLMYYSMQISERLFAYETAVSLYIFGQLFKLKNLNFSWRLLQEKRLFLSIIYMQTTENTHQALSIIRVTKSQIFYGRFRTGDDLVSPFSRVNFVFFSPMSNFPHKEPVKSNYLSKRFCHFTCFCTITPFTPYSSCDSSPSIVSVMKARCNHRISGCEKKRNLSDTEWKTTNFWMFVENNKLFNWEKVN